MWSASREPRESPNDALHMPSTESLFVEGRFSTRRMDDGIRSEIQKLKQIAAENVVAAEIALKQASVVSMEIERLRRTGETSPCPSGLENEYRVVEEPFSEC